MIPINPYIENAEKWINLAGIDYITQYVIAWISFNAWYKNSYSNIERDSEIISEIKNTPNAFRNRIDSLLSGNGTEHLEFQTHIANLYRRLEDNHIHNKDIRLSFTGIDFGPNPTRYIREVRTRCTYIVERGPIDPATGNQLSDQHILCIVQNSKGIDVFRHMQTNGHNIQELTNLQDFQSALNLYRQNNLTEIYEWVSPRRIESLLSNDENKIEIGGLRFRNDIILICQGLISLLYQLRNVLFHGQIIPNNATNRVYEPAYHILYTLIQSLR